MRQARHRNAHSRPGRPASGMAASLTVARLPVKVRIGIEGCDRAPQFLTTAVDTGCEAGRHHVKTATRSVAYTHGGIVFAP